MKLATYQDGSRDGQLVLVSRDLSQAHYASGIASRMQAVLDDWGFLSPQLEELYTSLNHGRLRHAFNFEPQRCMAPLPRAYQWIEGSAYLSHEGVLRKAAAEALPDGFHSEPVLVQGGSDDFLGACEPARFGSEAMGIDFVAELAVVTGDIDRGASAEQSLEGVRLMMLANGWRLRHLASAEQAKGAAPFQSKAAPAFSPVAVTLDELGAAWRSGRVDLSLQTMWNGRKVGHCEAGTEMSFHFGQLLAQAAKTRRLRAGSIIGSGAVSKQDASHGFCSIAEKRAIEILDSGSAKTEYMRFGDSIRIEMKGRDGLSLFGAIDQDVQSPDAAAE